MWLSYGIVWNCVMHCVILYEYVLLWFVCTFCAVSSEEGKNIVRQVILDCIDVTWNFEHWRGQISLLKSFVSRLLSEVLNLVHGALWPRMDKWLSGILLLLKNDCEAWKIQDFVVHVHSFLRMLYVHAGAVMWPTPNKEKCKETRKCRGDFREIVFK